jgi:hypothetical protein
VSDRLRLCGPDPAQAAIFSCRLGPAADDPETILWLKLEVASSDGTGAEVVADFRDDPCEALIAFDDDEAWSPDGRVLLLARALNVTPTGDFAKHVYVFLDTQTAAFAGFAANGQPVTTDNFAGWEPTSPHSPLLRVDDGRLKRAELITYPLSPW